VKYVNICKQFFNKNDINCKHVLPNLKLARSNKNMILHINLFPNKILKFFIFKIKKFNFQKI